MSEMVERVARAIRECEEVFPLGDGRECLSDEEATALARAAIAAIREPTEAMIDAAAKTGRYGGISDSGGLECNDFDPEDVWEAMIDTALK